MSQIEHGRKWTSINGEADTAWTRGPDSYVFWIRRFVLYSDRRQGSRAGLCAKNKVAYRGYRKPVPRLRSDLPPEMVSLTCYRMLWRISRSVYCAYQQHRLFITGGLLPGDTHLVSDPPESNSRMQTSYGE